MSNPRVGSMMNLEENYGGGIMPLGNTYGVPPDCIKSSYDELHLTAEDLQQLAK